MSCSSSTPCESQGRWSGEELEHGKELSDESAPNTFPSAEVAIRAHVQLSCDAVDLRDQMADAEQRGNDPELALAFTNEASACVAIQNESNRSIQFTLLINEIDAGLPAHELGERFDEVAGTAWGLHRDRHA